MPTVLQLKLQSSSDFCAGQYADGHILIEDHACGTISETSHNRSVGFAYVISNGLIGMIFDITYHKHTARHKKETTDVAVDVARLIMRIVPVLTDFKPSGHGVEELTSYLAYSKISCT